VKQFTDM
jgi:hypothetical protein